MSGALDDGAGGATGRRGRALFLPLRLALTGEEHGPDLRALLPLIGRARAALGSTRRKVTEFRCGRRRDWTPRGGHPERSGQIQPADQDPAIGRPRSRRCVNSPSALAEAARHQGAAGEKFFARTMRREARFAANHDKRLISAMRPLSRTARRDRPLPPAPSPQREGEQADEPLWEGLGEGCDAPGWSPRGPPPSPGDDAGASGQRSGTGHRRSDSQQCCRSSSTPNSSSITPA